MSRPETRTVDQTDDFFGTEVTDPYRWLEHGDDPDVVAWLQQQAAHAREHLDGLPGRAEITAALDRAVRLPRSGLPVHRGANWFRTANDGRQQQDVLLVSDEPFGDARVLIDPNTPQGATSLAEWAPSPDGTLVAYSFSEAGSDWREWHVRQVDGGADRPDVVRWSKFTDPVWLPDGAGFLYGGYDAPDGDEYVAANAGKRIMLHRLGTEQDADELVFALPDEPAVSLYPQLTDDDRWLVVTGTAGTDPNGRIWVRDLAGEQQLRPLVTEADAAWHLVGSLGEELLMITDRDAPSNRLVALDAHDASVREVVAADDDQLEQGVLAGSRIVLRHLHVATARLSVYELDGTPVTAVELPGLGAIADMSARAEEPLVHLSWETFVSPPGVLRYDVAANTLATAFAAPLDSDLVTEQVMVGHVPLFLVHRRDVDPANGPHATWLYGYGGFRIAVTPDYDPTRLAFAEAGGVAAVACLRGGGEFGTGWHEAGRLANKQNVFDDAIACAQYLIDEHWTDKEHLALSGRSNGGLLAGAVLTQRPDLFGAVVPEVGVLDMLRFPLWTIGWAWTSDYGDPRADADQFATVAAYSPLHNLDEQRTYPPVLVMTSDHDDRVVPAHSLKFAARLQAVSPADAVALLRVDAASGHGAGRSHDALVAERADFLAFVSHHTGLGWVTSGS